MQAVGVSSSFVAQKTQGGKEGREQLLSVEEFDYWNLWDFKGGMLLVTDMWYVVTFIPLLSCSTATAL